MKSYNEDKVENANKIKVEKIDEEIYLITLTEFCDDITYNKFKDLIPDMEKSNELIIDLRGNSGGGFIDLKKILSLFVDNGKMIYQLDFSYDFYFVNYEGTSLFQQRELLKIGFLTIL